MTSKPAHIEEKRNFTREVEDCERDRSEPNAVNGSRLELPEPDLDNITVLTGKLPNKPILPWNHYDSPWQEEEEEEKAKSEAEEELVTDETMTEQVTSASETEGTAEVESDEVE
ncbi:MAG: hypothetical protein SAJ37_05505 [Oscillatoria sp. PMC 1068.18]|nr:hypothetical protein [Oscillatoria sp. PMC 1076.18]MEC4988186.1 hypothetical protein [Oscillatoria sp. PMC 1068.18]